MRKLKRRKRLTPIISRGNSKLGYVPNISFPPEIFCVPNAPCRQACYGWKAFRQYPETRAAWRYNAMLVTKYPDRFFAGLNDYLAKHRPKMFRFHVSGDIPNLNYWLHMRELAQLHPDVKFLCFTKKHYFNFTNIPPNLKIVLSYWPRWGNPRTAAAKHLPIAWMRDAAGLETRIPLTAKKCPHGCDSCAKCWNLKAGESVVFDEH